MAHYILYNPLAGRGTSEESVSALASKLSTDTVIQDITQIQDYASFVAKLTADDVIVLCGGDGTINRFVNDTQDISVPCDILYFAMGTGNDFLHDLEKSPSEPLSIKAYIQDLPVVEVNGKTYRFLNNVGFGIDGYCTQVGDEMKKNPPSLSTTRLLLSKDFYSTTAPPMPLSL